MTPSDIVQKLWSYCNVLRDDGMSYGGYVEQLTFLLLLKMADERTKAPCSQKSSVPEKYAWPTLIKKDGDDLFAHYQGGCVREARVDLAMPHGSHSAPAR